jgi:hypothetical protein
VIDFATLQAMFDNIEAKTDWDMSEPMLWGYFFTDSSREKLEVAAAELEQSGYRYVDMFEPDIEEGEERYLFLHVEKEEVHTPESLHRRNGELYVFAESRGLRSYDGMDVGPIGAQP